MKNFRNGVGDASPPLHHADTRPCFTGVAMGGQATIFGPGPAMATFPLMRGERLHIMMGAIMLYWNQPLMKGH